MAILFYLAAAVAFFATFLAITRTHPIHGLLYFIVSLFAVALVFFALGAPFVAALEVIIYAGAIMVLFVFVVMLLNLGPGAEASAARLLDPRTWAGPAVLSLILAVELGALIRFADSPAGGSELGPALVSRSLFGPYLLGVELASMLLLAGLVGAYHLGRRSDEGTEARR